MPLKNLLAANPGVVPEHLQVGQRVNLPCPGNNSSSSPVPEPQPMLPSPSPAVNATTGELLRLTIRCMAYTCTVCFNLHSASAVTVCRA